MRAGTPARRSSLLRQQVRWDITLAPDEKKELTYQYDRYVPSN